MKKVYGLTVNGQENSVNASGSLYFAWKLSDCKKQLSVTLTVLDGEEVIYTKDENTDLQVLTVEDLKLIPLKEYSFFVKVKTDCYEETSDKAFFISATADFGRARWISDGNHFVEERKSCGSPSPNFRKRFVLESLPNKAIASVCGLGFYEMHINGKRVGDRVLEPAFTDYHKRVLYSTYEVGELLKEGENLIEIALGDGWYNQTSMDTWGFFRAPWRDTVKMIFKLDCDGEETVVSDTSWEYAHGELVANTLRVGEFYDFTKKREYRNAFLTTPPGGALKPSYIPPIRECEVIEPIKSFKGENCVIYDFGKSMAGYCYAKIEGKEGDTVYFEYSDRLTDGRLDNSTNGMYIVNTKDYQKDGCKLAEGTNEYKPKFLYHGFRYVAVYGNAEIREIKAFFVHTDLKKLGEFSSSCDTLNTLYSMTTNAILSNYHGIPTDCPHREKNGWTGDAQLSIEPSVYNFDMQFAYKKWIEDFFDNQLPSGQISAIIPSGGWGFNWGSGPAWDIAFFRIPEALQRYYGDDLTVKEAFPYLEKYFAYMSDYVTDGLLAVGLGDWNYPINVEFETCPLELSTSCYYMYMASSLAEISKRLDPTKVEKYTAIAEQTKRAIKEKYSNERSLTGMAALDYFGILDKKAEVCRYLEEHDFAVHYGILGTKYVFEVLGKCGRSDIAYKILTRREYPSFAYWIDQGQTSLCEDFECRSSLNHHMYSPITEYMVKYFCGVDRVGVNKFEVNPSLPEGLDKVAYSFKTANGQLRVEVEKTDGKLSISLEIPSNCEVKYKDLILTVGKHTV